MSSEGNPTPPIVPVSNDSVGEVNSSEARPDDECAPSVRATALVSMTKSDKEHLKAVAKSHGLSLSAFLRLAADEYIIKHKW